jgi:hypothetical protein
MDWGKRLRLIFAIFYPVFLAHAECAIKKNH